MDRHIYIYGEIGWEVNAASVQEQLNAPGEFDNLIVHISSPGGGVFEGWTIGNIIKNSGKDTVCQIEGFCASIATFIALSCKKVEMADTGRFMIHNPSTFTEGEETDIEQAAEQLAKIKDDLIRTYKDKTGLNDKDLSEMMDKETWFTPEEAQKAGFVDSIIEPVKAVAKFDIKNNTMPEKENKEVISKLDQIMNKIKAWDPFKGEVKNVMVTLAEGGSIFVESEDGELEGKKAFTVEDGEATETPAPDGTHVLEDGRSITIEDGTVTSVQEVSEEENAMREEIKALKEELAAATEEKEKATEEGQKQMSEILKEVENLKRMTVGDAKPPAKVHHEPANKFDDEPEKGHSLDGFAKHIGVNVLHTKR